MKGDLIETIKMISEISNYDRHSFFSKFHFEMKIHT